MAYKKGWRALTLALGMVISGAVASAAWQNGFWGLFIGALLAIFWLAALNWLLVAGPARASAFPKDPMPALTTDGVLLDAAPVPMLEIADDHVRALNRAARGLFGTDDRVLPLPAGLLDPGTGHMRHEGRQWRIARVMIGGAKSGRMVAALIDVEQEERAAEARATAEMIHILGHELLNGLAPIVSLAESGEAALHGREWDPALLREILGTLARRAESLQRFTGAYRELARLPMPRTVPVRIDQIASDLSRLFAGRWPAVTLAVETASTPEWSLDRDQISQALWAVLQNAAEAASVNGARARVTLAIRDVDANLIIDVEDNGPGVNAEDAARIFRPFHSTKPDGTGIGLSLARQIVHAHGGSLLLVPNPNTTFRVILPR